MYRSKTYNITGVSPLLLHNGQTADPLNKWAKALKAVSGKRVKTDADHEEMSRIEWMAGLYIGEDGKPCIPGEVFEAALKEAAKLQKMGKAASSGIIVDTAAKLRFKGDTKTPEQLWEGGEHLLRVPVRVQQAKCMRTRPMFSDWSASVTVQYEDSILNENAVDQFMRDLGSRIGLCDWRPKFGRFTVK